MKSRFEQSLPEIINEFRGPFPLDPHTLEAFVDPFPGIYIWSAKSNGIKQYGYVGLSKALSLRLKTHARTVKFEAEFYFKYVPEVKLKKTEEVWILKAGDINER